MDNNTIAATGVTAPIRQVGSNKIVRFTDDSCLQSAISVDEASFAPKIVRFIISPVETVAPVSIITQGTTTVPTAVKFFFSFFEYFDPEYMCIMYSVITKHTSLRVI